MKKTLQRTIPIPEGINIEIKDDKITVKKEGNELTKKIETGNIQITKKEKEITLEAKNATRREARNIGTTWAHINNMIEGIQKPFEYKMEVCNVHFPMNVKIEGEQVTIKSFLGETTQRNATIIPGTKVDIKGSAITISSPSIEAAGQTAANIEKATRLKGRDRRIFQDGIFITEKNGRKI